MSTGPVVDVERSIALSLAVSRGADVFLSNSTVRLSCCGLLAVDASKVLPVCGLTADSGTLERTSFPW